MRNISDKICTEKHILCSVTLPENRTAYEKMWKKNMVHPVRPQMTIWRMRFAYCIPKATATHTKYAVLTAFRRQLCLHERPSMLRHTYIAFFRCSANKLNYTVRAISDGTL